MSASRDRQIEQMLDDGVPTKTIARHLGVTEWKVRTFARARIGGIRLAPKPKVELHDVKTKQLAVERWVVLSDVHVPYHDRGAVAVVMAYLRDLQPAGIVLNGDILDFHEISSHPKQPGQVSFEDECNAGRAFLRAIVAQHDGARIVYTMGNHEHRIERYLTAHAPELCSVGRLSLCELLDLEELGVEFLDRRTKLQLGGLEIFHGSIVRVGAGMSAKAHATRRGGSVLMGHTHRQAVLARTDKHGTHYAIENGHLSDPDPEWTQDPDWQQGFTELLVTGDSAQIRQHAVRDGVLRVDGVEYRADKEAASDGGKQRREEGRAASGRVARDHQGARRREHEPRRGARARGQARGRAG